MTFPSAGGRKFIGQGQFSKIVNSCPIWLIFDTHVCGPYGNVSVKYLNNLSNTVDVTHVSMATIWPIIKDRAFLSMISTFIPS
jgi:hypothetical protein